MEEEDLIVFFTRATLLFFTTTKNFSNNLSEKYNVNLKFFFLSFIFMSPERNTLPER